MNKNDALEKILQNIKLEDNNDRKIIDYQNSYIDINFDNKFSSFLHLIYQNH